MRVLRHSALTVVLLAAGATAARGEKRAMVVHLPEAPIESMSGSRRG